MTKWEDSPFEIILTTVIDHLCISKLLDKHIILLDEEQSILCKIVVYTKLSYSLLYILDILIT